MLDSNNREVNYMRLSVIDNCNLRCKYCMPEDQKDFLRQKDLMDLDDIKILTKFMTKLGISKVKLTGGEPLVRKDIGQIIKNIKQTDKIEQVTITTNGVDIDKYLHEIITYIDSINISIDTLDREKYHDITKRDELPKLLNNIQLLKENNMQNIKLNSLPLKESGLSNIIELVEYANENDITIRLIEMMPIGLGRKHPGYQFSEMLDILKSKYGKETLVTEKLGNGPAIYYRFEKLNNPVGFILAISNKFCETCNKIRITSNGHLKQCLHFNNNMNVTDLIKEDEQNALVEIGDFILNKPKEHAFHEQTDKELEKKNMSFIGG